MANMSERGRAAAPKGRVVRDGKDGPQLVEAGPHRMSEAELDRFLDHLAASCNATWSAKQVGFSREAIYKRRRNDPAFHTRWQAALAQGVARIDMLLVQRAEDFLAGRAPDPDSPIPTMTVQDAIAILKLHRATVADGEGKRPGWRGRPRSLDEMRDSILRKLSAIERHRGQA